MKKLFSLILILCMATTACAALADTPGAGLDSLYGSMLSGYGSEGGLSSLLSGLMSSYGTGEGGLGSLLGSLMSSYGSGEGGLSSLLGGLLGGYGGGEAGLGSLLGGLMSGGGSEADLESLLGSLYGGDLTQATAAGAAAGEAAADSTATDSTATDSTAADGTAAYGTAGELTPDEEAALEMAILGTLLKETSGVTYSKLESADAFYGTWIMKSVVVAGYEMNLAALEDGQDSMPVMVLKLSEEVYDLSEAGAEPAPKAITASELKDGELTISFYSEGKLTNETFRMTEAGELCLVETEAEGGHEEAPTYILFARTGA